MTPRCLVCDGLLSTLVNLQWQVLGYLCHGCLCRRSAPERIVVEKCEGDPLVPPSRTLRERAEATLTLRDLQDQLPWSIAYSDGFKASKEALPHLDFEHALIHVVKATGKLATMVDDADHWRDHAFDASAASDYLADLVICALRMASTFPDRRYAIDLQRAVIQRLESKNAVQLQPPKGKDTMTIRERDTEDAPLAVGDTVELVTSPGTPMTVVAFGPEHGEHTAVHCEWPLRSIPDGVGAQSWPASRLRRTKRAAAGSELTGKKFSQDVKKQSSESTQAATTPEPYPVHTFTAPDPDPMSSQHHHDAHHHTPDVSVPDSGGSYSSPDPSPSYDGGGFDGGGGGFDGGGGGFDGGGSSGEF